MPEAQIKQLRDSILTIGRTLPKAMEVHFYREEEDPRVRMQMVMPDGAVTDFAFLENWPITEFPLSTLLRETQLERALRDLLATIDLHTDCMTGLLERSALDSYIEAAERLLGEDWEVDEGHPANKVTSVPAIVSYPSGSLGEAVEVA